MSTPEIDDEGEGPVEDSLPPSAKSVDSGRRTPRNLYSLRGRIAHGWRIMRGKNMEELLTADPAEQIKNARAQQDNRWRGIYAVVLLIGMTAQIAIADYIFWRYLNEHNFDISDAVFIAFLTSVVVEVIGLVLVVTKSLFPSEQKHKKRG